MKINLKTKGIIKKIALFLAGIIALTAVGFGVKAVVDYAQNDLKTIKPTFEVGNLGTDGKFVNDESALYTKEAFGCYGLQVKPDFDSTVNYQIFYYDILDNYISSTDVLSEGYSGEAPLNGAYARMVIMPRDDEDDKISFTEKYKFPMNLTIKVKKEQDINNRFDILDGKILQRANILTELCFEKNVHLNADRLIWDNFIGFCVTSTFLSVSGGSTMNPVFSSVSGTVTSYRVFEFSDIPLAENIVTSTDLKPSDSVTFNKKTKYIMISCYKVSDEWTDQDVAKLPSCFTITKTK